MESSRGTALTLTALIAGLCLHCGEETGHVPDVDVVTAELPGEDVFETAPEEPPACNPLAADVDCLLPFPIDVFRVSDGGGMGKYRVVIPDTALVSMEGQGPVNIPAAFPMDGFAVDGPILALFEEEIDPDTLVFHTPTPEDSLSPTSTTILLHGETGEPVLHFAELDMRPEADGRRVLHIRPMVRLADGTRYIVGIHGLRNQEGALLNAPDGFRRLRDGDDVEASPLSALAESYEEVVFAPLEVHGVEREALQLAWSFTTRSEESATHDMIAIITDAITRLETAPPGVIIDSMEDSFEEGSALFQDHVARILRGHLTVPLYLDSTDPKGRLYRNGDGEPEVTGMAEVPFTVLIPRSVMEAPDSDLPAPVLQYGHGFFGTRSEAEGEAVVLLADQLGAVVVATDWWGMAKEDMPEIVAKLAVDTAEVTAFTDRVHQAMVNFMALAHACQTTLLEVEGVQRDGKTLFDGSEIFFYGNSVGHILGGTYVALSPHIQRAVFGVGGASMPLMMSRSTNFAGFMVAFQLFLGDAADVIKLVALYSTSINRIDPITYAPYIFDTPLPWAPPERRVLMQVGIADTQVPNLSSHLHARALGLQRLEPSPREIPGISGIDVGPEGMDISALLEVDFQIDPDPTLFADFPDGNNCVHEEIRLLPPIQEQVVAFLRGSQRVVHPCEGPCEATCKE